MTQKSWSGGFLYDPKLHSVLLHKRDVNTKINPNKWAFFGGLKEGSEDSIDCFIREIQEELGLSLNRNQVIPLREYLNTELNTERHVFFVESDIDKSALILGEGAGFDWIPLKELNAFDLTEKTKEDIAFFKQNVL